MCVCVYLCEDIGQYPPNKYLFTHSFIPKKIKKETGARYLSRHQWSNGRASIRVEGKWTINMKNDFWKNCYKVTSSVAKTKNKRNLNCWQEFAVLKRVIRAWVPKKLPCGLRLKWDEGVNCVDNREKCIPSRGRKGRSAKAKGCLAGFSNCKEMRGYSGAREEEAMRWMSRELKEVIQEQIDRILLDIIAFGVGSTIIKLGIQWGGLSRCMLWSGLHFDGIMLTPLLRKYFWRTMVESQVGGWEAMAVIQVTGPIA